MGEQERLPRPPKRRNIVLEAYRQYVKRTTGREVKKREIGRRHAINGWTNKDCRKKTRAECLKCLSFGKGDNWGRGTGSQNGKERAKKKRHRGRVTGPMNRLV